MGFHDHQPPKITYSSNSYCHVCGRRKMPVLAVRMDALSALRLCRNCVKSLNSALDHLDPDPAEDDG